MKMGKTSNIKAVYSSYLSITLPFDTSMVFELRKKKLILRAILFTVK